jgi:hypothetical protein
VDTMVDTQPDTRCGHPCELRRLGGPGTNAVTPLNGSMITVSGAYADQDRGAASTFARPVPRPDTLGPGVYDDAVLLPRGTPRVRRGVGRARQRSQQRRALAAVLDALKSCLDANGISAVKVAINDQHYVMEVMPLTCVELD